MQFDLKFCFAITAGIALCLATAVQIGFFLAILVALIVVWVFLWIYRPQTASRRTTIALLGVPLLMCVLVFLTPPMGHPKWQMDHFRAKNQTSMVMLAISNYQDTHQAPLPRCTYDANGRSMHSWRAFLMRYMDDIYDRNFDPRLRDYRFDEPWDSPHNRQLHDCKSPFHLDNDPGDPTHTSVVALVTDQGDSMQQPFNYTPEKAAKTYLMTGKNLGIHWLSPEDVDFVDPQLFREGDRKHPLRKGNFTIQSNGDVEDTGEPIK